MHFGKCPRRPISAWPLLGTENPNPNIYGEHFRAMDIFREPLVHFEEIHTEAKVVDISVNLFFIYFCSPINTLCLPF